MDSADTPLSTRDAADYLGVNYFTLSRWRSEGRGPTFVQLGPRIIRYRRAALDAFLDAQSVPGGAA